MDGFPRSGTQTGQMMITNLKKGKIAAVRNYFKREYQLSRPITLTGPVTQLHLRIEDGAL